MAGANGAPAGSLVVFAACLASSALRHASAACEPAVGEVADCASSPVVHTKSGPIQGFDRMAEGTTVSTFWGLPFAEPPVRTKRFMYPEPYSGKWSDMRRATKQANECPQFGHSLAGDEDCLYLNVYTPRVSIGNTTLLPVMFWIYGGGFKEGDGFQKILLSPLYDGAAVVGRHNVVIVTTNYRLSALGFNTFVSGPNGETGNQGIADQRTAMSWTQENIRAFGGDPTRVTIYGESAGAFSVMSHLVSPTSWPLFSQAIMESGGSKNSWLFPSKEDAVDLYQGWALALGCAGSGPQTLACLQGLPVEAFIKPPANYTGRSPAYPKFPFGPVIDGSHYGIPGVPIELVKAGKFKKVPLILGMNMAGGSIFEPELTAIVPGMHQPNAQSARDVELALNWTFPQDVDEILSAYPISEYQSEGPKNAYKKQFARIIRDVVFGCSNRNMSTLWHADGLDAYLYTFSFDFGTLDKLLQVGTFHASELVFVFRNYLWIPEVLPMTGDVKGMADIVSCQWTSFAYTGDPNGGSDPSKWPPGCQDIHGKVAHWPKFDGDRNYMMLDSVPKVQQVRAANQFPDDAFPSDEKCNMWDRVTSPWHPKKLAWKREGTEHYDASRTFVV